MVFIGKFPRRKDKSCPEILKVVDIFRRISYIWTANWITWNTISQNIPAKFLSKFTNRWYLSVWRKQKFTATKYHPISGILLKRIVAQRGPHVYHSLLNFVDPRQVSSCCARKEEQLDGCTRMYRCSSCLARSGARTAWGSHVVGD